MEFGYLRPTFSRWRYEIAQSELHPLAPKARKADNTSICGDSSEPSDDTDWREDFEHFEDLKPATTIQITSQTERNDLLTQQAIATRTRLADKISNHKVYINHDSLFDILSAAETLVKRCVWEWTRTYLPKPWCDWFGYLSDVDLSTHGLCLWFDCMPDQFFKFRSSQSWQVKRKLKDLIRFRNILHHFRGAWQDVCTMDAHLEDVQQLAVLFYDEESAMRARALRDRLGAEAEQTLEEIERLTMLTSLPEGGDPWLKHHTDLIRVAVRDLDTYRAHKHPIVDTAAREWASHRRDQDYGISIPDSEGNTKTDGSSANEPGLSDMEGSE